MSGNEPQRRPEPWVDVDTTPAMVCASYPPMFGSARPRRSSSSFSARSGVPPSTRTSECSRASGRSVCSSNASSPLR
jgi:hypothetical protein